MDLRDIQLKELEILKETLKIIKKYNLRYFMLGGTFLGAVRHKGFIPWDDDIDIGMPRADYEKFIEYAKIELKHPFDLKSFENDSNYQQYIIRIINKDIFISRNDAINLKTENIWIDIFPLDGMPDNSFIRKLHKFHLLFLRLLLQYSKFKTGVNMKKKRSFLESLLIKFGYIFSKVIKLNKIKRFRAIDKSLKKYPYDNSRFVVNFMGAYKFKEMFPRELYENPAEYDFEDLKLCAPSDYDTVLKQMYGDYMTPPSDDQKFSHSIRIQNNAE